MYGVLLAPRVFPARANSLDPTKNVVIRETADQNSEKGIAILNEGRSFPKNFGPLPCSIGKRCQNRKKMSRDWITLKRDWIILKRDWIIFKCDWINFSRT